MLTEEKIKEVKKQLRSGIPEGEIKNDLIGEGFTEDEIQNLFTPHKSDMRSWYLGSAILLLLLWIIAGNTSILIFSGIMLSLYIAAAKQPAKEETDD